MANSSGIGFPTTNLQKGHTFHDIDEGATYIFIDGDPRLQSSWRLVNGIFSGDPDTSQWGLQQKGATWYNAALGAMRFWTGSAVQSISIAGVISNMYDVRNGLAIQEDFLSGVSTTGQIGSVGFNATNGTVNTFPASEDNHPGIYQRGTGGTINTVASLHLSSATPLLASMQHAITWIVRPNNIDADSTYRAGAMISVATNPPTNGIYFERLGSDTNWFAVTRSGGVETRTDLGISASANFIRLFYNRDATSVKFYVDGTLLATHTSNIPTVAFGPATQVVNLAAASKTLDHDYFDFSISEISR